MLVVRLQAVGFSDPRRAVSSYHELAREARGNLARVRSEGGQVQIWTSRLADLGVRVASTLLEMGDPLGAACHLETLRDAGDGKVALAQALVWLQIGDQEAATRCVQNGGDGGPPARVKEVVAALCAMAASEYTPALEKWSVLAEEDNNEMVVVNMAVCLLYLGRIAEVR